ncbi:RHS repeat-associated core domain-containing protein, partial [Mesorhizobium sp. M7A.F.Ca.CA.002.15.1.1]
METGLAYNWHRHYDASIGRYLQPDPLGMPNGPSRWAYVGNSPLMKVDPSGLYWVPGPGGNRWWCWGGNPLDCVLR